jgi:AcrR family transcriptional regulator
MANKSKEEIVEEFRIRSIQEAALRVIARRGLEAASMQEIADEAGIAKGTIYLYFQNQAELLERTFDAALTSLLTRLEAALAIDDGFRGRLRRLIHTQIEYFDGQRDLFRLLVSARHSGGRHTEQCSREQHPQYREWKDKFRHYLRQAVDKGEMKPVDLDRFTLFIEEGTIAVLMQRLNETLSPPVDEDVDWIVEMILDGVAARRSRK